ncbi:MAG: aminotransferase class V-fold PLP-dependent enzyme [Clostridia bacterium]|nr:aminotransferase class V-fold PLP-dependent enzyme [Clostridia bacterium]
MIRFDCDYLEGAHPKIIEKLVETNMEQTAGYGCDPHCTRAKEMIKKVCNAPESDVHFLVGGTQTNTAVISSALRIHQGVISAQSGHINVHESGAIEATGHKVLALPSSNGKLTTKQIEECFNAHHNDVCHEHMVQPAMVYISLPTEGGTVYTKKELEDIYSVCKNTGMFLYIDGARLGYALASDGCDLTLPDVAANCDVFYIGGTKVGALFGEALVINNEYLKKDFRYVIKQKGGLLAKGRLLGIQFETLFEDGLYFEISAYAIECAKRIHEIFESNGYEFLFDSTTNQQFPIIPDNELETLSKEFTYDYWCALSDKKSGVRFCASWATKQENLDKLENAVKALK